MMNMMSLVLVAVVAFTYFGGQNVPKVLKDNKQMLLGVFVGVLASQFLGLRIEGFKLGGFDFPDPQGGEIDAFYEEVKREM